MARAYGSGSVYKNKNGTWTAQINTPSGRKSKTFPTQRKGVSWLAQMKRDMDTGDYVDPSLMPLSVWWDKWIETYKKPNVGSATLETYRSSRRRLPVTLFDMEISKITIADIQSALNSLTGRRRTIEITRTALNMCFQQAVTDGLIRRNPVRGTTLPSDNGSNTAKALTDEDDEKLLEILTADKPAKDKHIRDALYFCRMTGVRRAEACNLQWEDVTNKIHIRGTKTKGSDRYLPLLPEVRAMLDRRRFTSNSKYVFATYNGNRIDPSNLARWMRNNTDYSPHDLRHTYITRGAQAGINPKILASLTGHVNVKTLLDVYTHVSEADQIEAAAKINSICKQTANVN